MEIIKTIARLIRNCLYPPHPSDAAYEKAKEAYKKFQQSKSHLEKAIVSYEEAVEQRRPDHQELATTLVNLATATWNSYELSNRPEDKLDKVIALQEEALSLWKERNPKPEGYPVLLTNLGNAYMERYWKCEAKSAIENAIRIFQEAHDITPTDAKTHIMAAMRLGMAISTYCDHESQTDNRIDSAIEYLTKAYTLCAQHSYKSIMADCTYNLAGAHRTRFNLNQELRPGDRSSTINFYKITLQLIPPDHPHCTPSLCNLSWALFSRYQKEGREQDLVDAKYYAPQAMGSVDPNDVDLLQTIVNFNPATERRGGGARSTRSSTLDAGHPSSIRAGGARQSDPPADFSNVIDIIAEPPSREPPSPASERLSMDPSMARRRRSSVTYH